MTELPPSSNEPGALLARSSTPPPLLLDLLTSPDSTAIRTAGRSLLKGSKSLLPSPPVSASAYACGSRGAP
eukprot:scaffold3743_cov389-Prasinococcus_capsulatus_cf.AAC.17